MVLPASINLTNLPTIAEHVVVVAVVPMLGTGSDGERSACTRPMRERGLNIPDSTVFVGAFHNTCDDNVVYFDLDRLTPSQATTFAQLRELVDEARQRNAHERVRRFGIKRL